MEQRISYTLGFDIENTVVAREPLVSGGFFGLTQNVPSALRGPAEGFTASVLIRPRLTPYHASGISSFAPIQFLAGSVDLVNLEGWAFILGTDPAAGSYAVCQVGDTVLNTELTPNKDYLLTVQYDGNTTAFLYANGVQVDFDDTVTYVTGPDNFGIGGTPDASFIASLPAGFAWGAVATMIGGVMVGPYSAAAAVAGFLASPAVEQYNAVYDAQDMVNPGPSAIPGGETLPDASYLWSTRRGLPQLVDNGNEVWADEVAGLELQRIGTQQGATVGDYAPNWGEPRDLT